MSRTVLVRIDPELFPGIFTPTQHWYRCTTGLPTDALLEHIEWDHERRDWCAWFTTVSDGSEGEEITVTMEMRARHED